MLDFDAFVQTLGAAAEQYTPDQLRQLHVDILQVAEILLQIYRSGRLHALSTEHAFDDPGLDRTIESQPLTPVGATDAAPAVPHS
jgi:hypothetical protein